MQIVIDIPEDIYYDVFQYVECLANSDFELLMMRAIKNGVLLPKGHGRLIDAHKLNIPPEEMVARMAVQYAPTVIEADTESEAKE